MFNRLNQTRTVAYLVIGLIAVVIISVFVLKRSYVDSNGKELKEEVSFFGKKIKKNK